MIGYIVKLYTCIVRVECDLGMFYKTSPCIDCQTVKAAAKLNSEKESDFNLVDNAHKRFSVLILEIRDGCKSCYVNYQLVVGSLGTEYVPDALVVLCMLLYYSLFWLRNA